MEVKVLDSTKLSNSVIGARTCWDSFHNGGDYSEPTNEITNDDEELLGRLVNKFKHESIVEHAVIIFSVKGVSRALLQEVARTRIASISVRSSRYTLTQLKKEEPFFYYDYDGYEGFNFKRAEKYIVFTGNEIVDKNSMYALEGLRIAISKGISNDIVKYCMPESFKTDFVWTLNLRALKHLINLRSDKSALWEYRNLIKEMWKVIPNEWKFILEDVYKIKED